MCGQTDRLPPYDKRCPTCDQEMPDVTVSAEVVAAYWRHHQLIFSEDPIERADADHWFWAWEEVDEAALAASPGIVALLVALAKAAPNDQALAYLGAGPLEDLIRRHGAEFVDAIDLAAQTSESFRVALRCVWYGADTNEAMVPRLRRFGPPL
jgi:hypothetical protein